MMKNLVMYSFLALLLVACKSKEEPCVREKQLFDSGWRFHRGDVSGAERREFDASSWREVDLPHDFSIECIEGSNSPFDSTAIAGINSGFMSGGIGWYRKEFEVPADLKNQRIEINFEGAYMNTDVWVNGHHLGNHPYGYTQFRYNITDLLDFGRRNTIAVQVKNEGKNSRWYSGSGLYRHVCLDITSLLHIPADGTYVVSSQISDQSAMIAIETTVQNGYSSDKEVSLETVILDSDKREVGKVEMLLPVSSGNRTGFKQELKINSPKLWSVEEPNLYVAQTKVIADGRVEDIYETPFGIRSFTINAKEGFVLNGKPLKLKGGCVHHDNGPLGAKAYDRAEERKVELLKANGYNAVRTSHNPPSVAFLNACDRLGLLVLDEAFDMWQHGKNPEDYHLYFEDNWKKDIDAMVKRDRNHPSIIMWSIGNEIPAMDTEQVANTAHMIAGYIRLLEPTRPITAGMNNLSEKLNEFCSALDVCGYNYAVGGYLDKYETDICNHPERVFYGSESYALDEYDAWAAVEANPAVIGDFVWTAIDYIGEASIGWHGYPQSDNVYPWSLAYCGDIDICGWKRPQAYYRDAFWNEAPNVSIVVHSPYSSFDPLKRERIGWSRWHYDDVVREWKWNGCENQQLDVDVYSSCDRVELFLNGRSLGIKEVGRQNKCKVSYSVPYIAGSLKAIGYKDGKQVTDELLTASAAETIRLSADRTTLGADGQELSYVTVELCDKNGLRDTKAENDIRFAVTGPGTIVGVGNANPVSLESYTQPSRKAWKGRCLVIVKSGRTPGRIELTATAEGLPSESICIDVQ